jgi:superfamily II DNA/RNA helicase
MERYLSLDEYNRALSEEHLPSAIDFQRLIIESEAKAFIGIDEFDEEIEQTAWYLFSVCISKDADETYGTQRIHSALRICAHAFDILSKDDKRTSEDRKDLIVAAQFAYITIGQEPFAIALYRRLEKPEISYPRDLDLISTELCMSFFALDAKRIYDIREKIANTYAKYTKIHGAENLSGSPFAAVYHLSESFKCYIDFLIYGHETSISKAQSFLESIPSRIGGYSTLRIKMIATMLRRVSKTYEKSSLWKVINNSSLSKVIPAFSYIQPRLLSLWSPQLDVLDQFDFVSEFSFNKQVSRLFLSTPTSSGKTLLSQLLISLYLVESFKKVIYVAPTRALCKEVHDSLQARMRYLRKKSISGLPDFADEYEFLTHNYSVEVMTPERLISLLRIDRDKVLQDTGLFVFDEVHNIGNGERGGTYEECISIINANAAAHNTKLILISAVVGDKSLFITWLGGVANVQTTTSNWLGSRRIKGIYYTKPRNWENSENGRSTADLEGRIALKIDPDKPPSEFTFRESVGVLVTRNGKKDQSNSTSNYRCQLPLIEHLRNSGPVLVVAATKDQSVLIAKALCERCTPKETKALEDFRLLIEARLGSAHPLHSVLKFGVAFHHGSLPIDIREGIEALVRSGVIDVLCATTTMTEGVNLAVRSVLISATGSYGTEGYNEYIIGKTLLNAIGRAGRAGKETEGIVILAINEKPNRNQIMQLSPTDEQLKVDSFLFSQAVFEAWNIVDRSDSDWIFKIDDPGLEKLVSLIWFSLLGNSLENDSNRGAARKQLSSTYGWNSISSDQQSIVIDIINHIEEKRRTTPANIQKYWAMSGGSIRSANEVYRIANTIIRPIIQSEEYELLSDYGALLLNDGILERIFSLHKAPSPLFRRSKKLKPDLRVNLVTLVNLWLDGEEVSSISAKVFESNIKDQSYAVDQLNDFIYDSFEIHLSSQLSKIIDAIASILDEHSIAHDLNKQICSYVRWGVNSPTAIDLIYLGLPSRILASKIARIYDVLDDAPSVIEWLRAFQIHDWVELFKCTRSEIRSLLHLCREDYPISLRAFLEDATAKYPLNSTIPIGSKYDNVVISVDNQTELFDIPILHEGKAIGYIPPQFIPEIEELIATGIPCNFSIESSLSEAHLIVNAVNS